MEDSNTYKSRKKEMIATSLRIEKMLLTTIDQYGREIDRSRNWVVNKLLRESLAEIKKQ